jgi:protein SDA1
MTFKDKKNSTEIQLALRVGKKTASRKKKTERALKALKKEKKSKKVESYQTDSLHLLYDAQDFVEKLFKEVEQTNEGFEIKLMMIELIARLIGTQNLFLLNFYSFLIRFLTPHQREVAKMLWFAAISAHELVPPDVSNTILINNKLKPRDVNLTFLQNKVYQTLLFK